MQINILLDRKMTVIKIPIFCHLSAVVYRCLNPYEIHILHFMDFLLQYANTHLYLLLSRSQSVLFYLNLI